MSTPDLNDPEPPFGPGGSRNNLRYEIPYRRDVDGLRGVAVLAVMAYHAFPESVPGGFVGVDIFFVISGYLISQIILNGLRQHRFSIASFYARRIRRIFPALAIVLSACLLLGWYLMFEDEYQRLGKHVASGAAFVANLGYWSETGYFDTSAELKPLLHLWSLGIEEQFYVFWPLILAIAFRKSTNVIRLVAAIAIASFALNVIVTSLSPAIAFYMPLTRAWELMIGSLLACWAESDAARIAESGRQVSITPREANALAWTGVIGVLGSFAIVDRYRNFPGWWAALPVLCTAILIAFGPGTWFNRRILGSRVAVSIGLISYPLYLWHWPLLSFARIANGGRHDHWIEAGLVALSFPLAFATYRFVEQPIRTKRKVSPGILFATVSSTAFVGLLAYGQLVPPRSSNYSIERIVAPNSDLDFPGNTLKPFQFGRKTFFREGGSARTTLYIGDSTMQQYYMRIDKVVAEHPHSTRGIVFATASACAPIPDLETRQGGNGCRDFVNSAYEYARQPDIDTIVIAGQWQLYFLDPDRSAFYAYVEQGTYYSLGPDAPGTRLALESLGRVVASLTRSGKKVYVVLCTPVGVDLDPRNLVDRPLLYGFRKKRPYVDRAEIDARLAPITTGLKEVTARSGGAVIDPVESLCNKQVCPALTSRGYPIYRDRWHVRPSFARDYVTFLDETLDWGQ